MLTIFYILDNILHAGEMFQSWAPTTRTRFKLTFNHRSSLKDLRIQSLSIISLTGCSQYRHKIRRMYFVCNLQGICSAFTLKKKKQFKRNKTLLSFDTIVSLTRQIGSDSTEKLEQRVPNLSGLADRRGGWGVAGTCMNVPHLHRGTRTACTT